MKIDATVVFNRVLNDHLLGKRVWGAEIWDLVVLVPDHCLSFYFSLRPTHTIILILQWNSD